MNRDFLAELSVVCHERGMAALYLLFVGHRLDSPVFYSARAL